MHCGLVFVAKFEIILRFCEDIIPVKRPQYKIYVIPRTGSNSYEAFHIIIAHILLFFGMSFKLMSKRMKTENMKHSTCIFSFIEMCKEHKKECMLWIVKRDKLERNGRWKWKGGWDNGTERGIES